MLKIERFRPKSICLYLQNLLKSDDFEGFEAEDILRKEFIPPLDQANAFEFGGLHTICAGAMNKENEMVVMNVQLSLYHITIMYIGWYGSNNYAGAVL